jgi:hypothetical protein
MDGGRVFDRTNLVLSAEWRRRMCGSDAAKGLASKCLRRVAKVLKKHGDVCYVPRLIFQLITRW